MKLIEKTSVFTPENAPTESCHASTLCFLGGGRLMAAWFGGTHESADDVEIYAAVCENGLWRDPVRVSEKTDEACWNPVLWASPDGEIRLFFKRGRTIAGWRTVTRTTRDGRTWSGERELVPGDNTGGRGPVKNKPILLSDGTLLAGASHESPDGKIWRAFFDRSADGGLTWERTEYLDPIPPARLIQPTLWEDGEGVHALLRSDSGALCRADSADLGRTWSRAYPTALPNNNSGVDCVRTEDGRIALAMNPVGSDWGARTPLSLLASSDGGRSWKRGLDLARGAGEYSYPAVIARDGRIIAAFTDCRRGICFCVAEA